MNDDSQQQTHVGTKPVPIFRQEALEHHSNAHSEAHLLHLTPYWARLCYWLLLAICSMALCYAVLGRVNEYASGTAVIEAEGRIDITAHIAGTVEAVAVRPGDPVTAGQIVARLYAAGEAAELEQVDRELDLTLIKLLQNPGDAAARAAIAALRAQRELAASRLEERTLRAPRAGVASDIRIRPGQELARGDVVLSLAQAGAGFRVIAMFPGHAGPRLRPGMLLRLELMGFAYAYQTATIDKVSQEVIGPGEARRYLRQPIADALATSGPVIIVEASLGRRSFTTRGEELDLHDGMIARAEVAVRSERILLMLFPGLETLF